MCAETSAKRTKLLKEDFTSCVEEMKVVSTRIIGVRLRVRGESLVIFSYHKSE